MSNYSNLKDLKNNNNKFIKNKKIKNALRQGGKKKKKEKKKGGEANAQVVVLIKIIRRLIDHHLHHLICALSLSISPPLSSSLLFLTIKFLQISLLFSSQTNKQINKLFVFLVPFSGGGIWSSKLSLLTSSTKWVRETFSTSILWSSNFPVSIFFSFSSLLGSRFFFFLLFFGFSRFLVLFFVWRLFMVFNCSRF